MMMNSLRPLLYFLLILLTLNGNRIFCQELTVGPRIKTHAVPEECRFSADGRSIAVAENGLLNLYDDSTGNFLKTIDTLPLKGFALLGGDYYAKQSKDSLAIGNFFTQSVFYRAFNDFRVCYLAFRSESGIAAVANFSGFNPIVVFNKDSVMGRIQLPPGNLFIHNIDISSDGSKLAVLASDSGFRPTGIRVYDLTTMNEIGTISPMLSLSMKFGRQSNQLWAIDKWRQVHIFSVDAAVHELSGFFEEYSNGLNEGIEGIVDLCLLPSGEELLTISENGYLSRWEITTRNKYAGIYTGLSKAKFLRISQNGRMGAIVSADSTVLIVHIAPVISPKASLKAPSLVLQTKHKGRITTIINDTINNLIYTHDGYTGDGDVKIWDRSNLLQLKTVEDFQLPRLTRNHGFLVGTRKILDCNNLENVTPDYITRGAVYSNIIDFEPEKQQLLIYDDNVLKYLDYSTGAETNVFIDFKSIQLPGQEHPIKNLSYDNFAFSNSLIATTINNIGGFSGRWAVLLNDLKTGKELKFVSPPVSDSDFIVSLLLNNKLPLLVARSRNAVYVCDYSNNAKPFLIIDSLKYTRNDVYSLAFSCDGKRLLVGYLSGKIAVWNMESFTKEKDFVFNTNRLISAIECINDHSAYVASEGELFVVDYLKGIQIANFGNAQDVDKIDQLLVDTKNDILYSLQNNRISSWNFHSVLNFRKTDFARILPPYIQDIGFSSDSTELLATDLFQNPNIYDIARNAGYTGSKIGIPPYFELNGIHTLETAQKTRIMLGKHSTGELYTLAIFNSDGSLVANLWDSLRFYRNYNDPFLLNLKQDSVFIVLTFKKNSRKRNIYAFSIRNYKGRVVYESNGYISHLQFVNDTTLMVVGLELTVINTKTARPVLTSQITGGEYFIRDTCGKRIITASSRNVYIWNLGNPFFCNKSWTCDQEITSIAIHPKMNILFIGCKDGQIKLLDLQTMRSRLNIYSVDSSNYIVQNSKGYYYSTRQIAPDYISYRQQQHSYLFGQFDATMNRPDTLTGDFWNVNEHERELLRTVTRKRRSLNEHAGQIEIDAPITPIRIRDRLRIPAVTSSGIFTCTVDVQNGNNAFTELIIVDNGNRLRPIQLKHVNSTSGIKVSVELNEGMNRIKLYAQTSGGEISEIKELKISFVPEANLKSKIYFIGIGVNHYQQQPDKALFAAVKDIRDLSKAITDKQPDAYTHLILEENATRESIMAVKETLAHTNIEDKVIIAYSGHGFADKYNQFYLGTTDINFHDPSSRGVSYDDIVSIFDNIPARKKLLLIDACNSGELDTAANSHDHSIPNSKISMEEIFAQAKSKLSKRPESQSRLEIMRNLFTDLKEDRGIIVISASQGYGTAEENANLANGTFTACVLACLTGKSALPSLQSDAVKSLDQLTVKDLQKFVIDRVPILTQNRQQPTSRVENIEYNWRIW